MSDIGRTKGLGGAGSLVRVFMPREVDAGGDALLLTVCVLVTVVTLFRSMQDIRITMRKWCHG